VTTSQSSTSRSSTACIQPMRVPHLPHLWLPGANRSSSTTCTQSTATCATHMALTRTQLATPCTPLVCVSLTPIVPLISQLNLCRVKYCTPHLHSLEPTACAAGPLVVTTSQSSTSAIAQIASQPMRVPKSFRCCPTYGYHKPAAAAAPTAHTQHIH
jgi:hypothetical protein